MSAVGRPITERLNKHLAGRMHLKAGNPGRLRFQRADVASNVVNAHLLFTAKGRDLGVLSVSLKRGKNAAQDGNQYQYDRDPRPHRLGSLLQREDAEQHAGGGQKQAWKQYQKVKQGLKLDEELVTSLYTRALADCAAHHRVLPAGNGLGCHPMLFATRDSRCRGFSGARRPS